MKTSKLGDTDLELTNIGLGTWAIGGSGWDFGWGPQEEKASIETIHEALELGINWIDTAPAYGLGNSERVVGKAVKEWGERVIIATKCSLLGNEYGGIEHCLKKESIRNEVEDSLRNLQVDAIDLYQIHWPMPEEDIEEGFETVLRLKEEGKVRWVGVSNFSVEQLERISKFGHVSSQQPPYSLIERSIENDVLPWCAKNNTGVIAYSPLQCGLLTGKVTAKWVDSLPEDDWRKKKSKLFREPKLSKINAFVAELQKISEETDHSSTQLAVSWVLRRPEVTAAIVGARKPGQIREVVAAAQWELGEQELERIEECSSFL